MKYAVEILAPAGCYPSLQAAIDSGADAVYFGLAQLNMRARARKSFHLKDLDEIMNRCRQAGIKGYLTMNTVLYQHDLALAKKLFSEAARCRVDGVIVSDMAAVQMASAEGLEIHLSTQLSISNFESFKFYSQFCDRIVLAREVNLSMISQINELIKKEDLRGVSGRPMEIEAFAHGALCIAVSGRCGMSLFTGNASANRGACEQNCRKEYEVTDKDTGQKLVLDNNFIMSPEDIATIDFLDELIKSGVGVLKIEGRGRSPEYVQTVTRAYRKAVDAINDGTYNKEFVEKLYVELQKVYNRGMSSGYYLGREQTWSATYGSKATRQKIYAGDITNYYSKIGVAEVRARTGQFKKGCEYVIVGDTTGVVEGVAEDLRLDNGTVSEVANGQIFSMKITGKVRRNDKLYLMRTIDA